MQYDTQRNREPENLFETLSTLVFILHFYCSEFLLLFFDFLLDLALLAGIFCRQFAEYIAARIFDTAAGLLAFLLGDELEEEADCDPIRVSPALMWLAGIFMMDLALDLLWMAFVPSLSLVQALAAALFTLPLLMVITEKQLDHWSVSGEYQRFREEAAHLIRGRE